MTLAPTLSACAADDVSDTTFAPATVTVAHILDVVGVKAIEEIPFPTPIAYVVVLDTNAGDSVPVLGTKEDKTASVLSASV
jgi:hypothetical protein